MNIYAACLVLININDNKILILQRSLTDDWMAGKYSLPGGGIEDNEDYKTGLLREVFEETGIKNIKINDNPYIKTNDKGDIAFLYGETNVYNVKLSFEHIGYKWVTLDELYNISNESVPDLYHDIIGVINLINNELCLKG